MTETLEDIIARHQQNYPQIVDLYEWSLNYEYPSPFSYFLDLIGYSNQEFGQNLGDWSKVTEKINLLELDYISKAVMEYLKDTDFAYQAIKDLVDFGG